MPAKELSTEQIEDMFLKSCEGNIIDKYIQKELLLSAKRETYV